MPVLEVVAKQPEIWMQLRTAAEAAARDEPQLGSQLNAVILSHTDLAGALSFQIARKLGDEELSAMTVREVCLAAYAAEPGMVTAAEADLKAVAERDPAIHSLLQPFLYFKGFPKIGKGVLLGAGAKVLGNIVVGDYAKVASGSVVLKPVPAGCTVAGVPARLVNCPTDATPARTMDHTLADIAHDFVI